MADEKNTVEVIDNRGVKHVPEEPGFEFGDKAVLTFAEEQVVVRDRIREHEEAIVRAELMVFENKILDNQEEVARNEAVIMNSYRLISAYVVAFNKRYGVEENG